MNAIILVIVLACAFLFGGLLGLQEGIHKSAKDSIYGVYPCRYMINNAIRCILNGNNDYAIEELLQVIWKADGYIDDDLAVKVNEIHMKIWDERHKS